MNTLFEIRTDEDLRREAVAANERRVHEVLTGRGPWEPSERQRRVIECLRGRQGRNLAMPIGDLMAKTGITPREIKQIVRDLVMQFGMAIVSSRDSEDGGYFFAVTAEERISGTADYVKEIVALGERVRIIRNLHDLRTLFGQISTEYVSTPSTGRP
jgi:hypothetical protein